jgi:hypothetical protein
MPFGRNSWPEFDATLQGFASGSADFRFVARNFLLDERVPFPREDSYKSTVALSDFRSETGWRDAHEEYLSARLFVTHGPPETFTNANRGNLLSDLEPRQHLIHLERAEPIARSAGTRADRLLEIAGDFLAGQDGLRGTLADTLEVWLRSRHRGPVFSSFWGEFSDLFEPDETSDWPDRCRDRMGMAHLAPTGGPSIPVILFRHPLRTVLDLRAKIPEAIQLVAVPTVLDTRMSPAFCPAPQEAPYGHVLDLSSDVPYRLRFEVIHPTPDYRPEDIFRIGQITSAPARTIEQARGLHLSLLRDIILRGDYATQTNGDLL